MVGPMNLISKEDANYRAANDDEMCKNCTSYKAPDICDRVENPVDATMVCDEFKPPTAEEAPVVPPAPVQPELAGAPV